MNPASSAGDGFTASSRRTCSTSRSLLSFVTFTPVLEPTPLMRLQMSVGATSAEMPPGDPHVLEDPHRLRQQQPHDHEADRVQHGHEREPPDGRAGLERLELPPCRAQRTLRLAEVGPSSSGSTSSPALSMRPTNWNPRGSIVEPLRRPAPLNPESPQQEHAGVSVLSVCGSSAAESIPRISGTTA